MPEKIAKVDGLSIRYWTNDNPKVGKSAVVLFHGNAFSLDNWKNTKTLDELSKDYKVFAIDLPAGKGSKSDKISAKDLKKPDSIVPCIEKIFDALEIGMQPVVIVGHSMGGGFALLYAIAHPDKVNALILVSPSVGRLGEDELKRISDLDIPMLLVWGEKDNLFPVEGYAKPLKEQLSRSKLLILKQAGHASYLDKPEEFNELLLDFLSEIS